MTKKEFEELVLKHYNDLMAYAVLRLEDKELAKDAVQHAIEDRTDDYPDFELDGPLTGKSWLLRAVHTKTIDVWRRQQRSLEDLDSEHTAHHNIETDQVEFKPATVERYGIDEDAAERSEIKVDVQNALQQLEDEDRIIAVAFLIEGYTHQEIADALELTRGQVRHRLKDVIEPKLRKILKAYSTVQSTTATRKGEAA